MNFSNIIKKQTTLIVIAAFLIAITAIGVSYSIFFDVKENKTNQKITAGTLEVTLSQIAKITPSVLAEEAGLKSAPINYTVNNSNSNYLPANYKVYLSIDSGNAIDASKIMISKDGNATKGTTPQALSTFSKVTTLNGKTGNYYQIETGSVNAGANSATKYLRVWIKEDDNATLSGSVKLSLYVESEVNEAAAK